MSKDWADVVMERASIIAQDNVACLRQRGTTEEDLRSMLVLCLQEGARLWCDRAWIEDQKPMTAELTESKNYEQQ